MQGSIYLLLGVGVGSLSTLCWERHCCSGKLECNIGRNRDDFAPCLVLRMASERCVGYGAIGIKFEFASFRSPHTVEEMRERKYNVLGIDLATRRNAAVTLSVLSALISAFLTSHFYLANISPHAGSVTFGRQAYAPAIRASSATAGGSQSGGIGFEMSEEDIEMLDALEGTSIWDAPYAAGKVWNPRMWQSTPISEITVMSCILNVSLHSSALARQTLNLDVRTGGNCLSAKVDDQGGHGTRGVDSGRTRFESTSRIILSLHILPTSTPQLPTKRSNGSEDSQPPADARRSPFVVQFDLVRSTDVRSRGSLASIDAESIHSLSTFDPGGGAQGAESE